MESQNNDHLQVETMTLDQAKQEIVHLRAIQEAMYRFLYVLCNYDIREPLQVVRTAPEFIQQEPLTKEQASLLAMITRKQEVIERTINSVIHAIRVEQGHVGPSKLSEFEKTDLRAFLVQGISLAHDRVNYDNALLADLLEEERYNSNVIIVQKDLAIVKTNIPEDLPPVRIDSEIIKGIIWDVTWFITGYHEKTEVEFNADFSDEWVNIRISCTAFDYSESVLREFQRFKTVPTFLALGNAGVLLLYNSWRMLQMYGSEMRFSIEKGLDAYDPRKATVTIALPRYTPTT